MNVITRYWNYWIHSDRRIGIWEDNDRYGYWHKPGASGRHRSGAFDVRYTVNANRRRVSVRDENSSEIDLAFLGCSWTFGHGVEDDECFPNLVGQTLGVSCENYGVGGWGTGHVLLALEDLFAEKTRVRDIVYLMIPHHLRRNATRRSWVRLLQKYHRRHPHFRLDGATARYCGLSSEADIISDDADLLAEHEILMTVHLLKAMHELCNANNSRLHVALAGGTFPYAVCEAVINHSTPIDLTHFDIEGFWKDEHPNPEDHRRLATKLVAHI